MTSNQTVTKVPAKSLKREVAGGLLAFWVVLTVKLFFLTDVSSVDIYSTIYTNITMILIPSCLTMFGLHHMKTPDVKMSSNKHDHHDNYHDSDNKGYDIR